MDTFDRFWSVYPKRTGGNPKLVARQKFDRAVKAGADPEHIIFGAKSYAAEARKAIGTEFIAMASTWLNQRRWEDYESRYMEAAALVPLRRVFVIEDSPGWQLWVAYWRLVRGKYPPTTDHHNQRGWWFETEYPPTQLEIV